MLIHSPLTFYSLGTQQNTYTTKINKPLNAKDWSEERVGDPVSLSGTTRGGQWPHWLTRVMTVVLAEDSVAVLVVVVLQVVVAVDLKHTVFLPLWSGRHVHVHKLLLTNTCTLSIPASKMLPVVSIHHCLCQSVPYLWKNRPFYEVIGNLFTGIQLIIHLGCNGPFQYFLFNTAFSNTAVAF